jgi:hypothetical protein
MPANNHFIEDFRNVIEDVKAVTIKMAVSFETEEAKLFKHSFMLNITFLGIKLLTKLPLSH